MPKEYGKLTAEQFQAFVRELPELRRDGQELADQLAGLPKSRLDALMVDGDLNWGDLYELTFTQHISIAVVAFNIADTVRESKESDDPAQYILDHWHPPADDHSTHPAFKDQHLIALAYSMQRTILSVMLFQRSMSGLVQEVREHDNLDSLFNAVRVDRTAMHCQPIADRIARAQLGRDNRFFLRLRNALKGPTQKHWQAYCDLRYSLVILREMGFDKMSDAQLEELLVYRLKVYPNTPSARKNLRAQYQQSKKFTTI